MKKTLLISTLACVTPIWADCVDGVRSTTDAEKQFYMETFAVLKTTIPAAPTGWRLDDRSAKITAPPSSVCTGSSKLPLRVGYEVRYYWQEGITELQNKSREFDKQIAVLRQLPPDKQKEFDDLGRSSRDLARQARKLMATDKAEAERLTNESNEIWKKAAAIRDAHMKSILSQIQEVTKQRMAAMDAVKTEVRLYVSVNGYNMSAPETAEKLSLPGAAVSVRGSEKTIVAFGPWKAAGHDIKANYPANGDTAKVRTVTIEATGDPKQIEPLLQAMNTSQLASMVAR